MKRAAILSLVATCIFSASTAFAAVPSVHTSTASSTAVSRAASRTTSVTTTSTRKLSATTEARALPTSAAATTRSLPANATTLPAQTKALPSMQRPGTVVIPPSTIPDMATFPIPSQSSAYAYHTDFGKSNLRKWSSTEGMDTPWNSNRTTDTVHLQSSTMAFLDTLNSAARAAGISFVITGGAEYGYHASGRYSHANGYKVDISDDGIVEGGRAYAVLQNALSAYKHQITHEWDRNHFYITIYPEDYEG